MMFRKPRLFVGTTRQRKINAQKRAESIVEQKLKKEPSIEK